MRTIKENYQLLTNATTPQSSISAIISTCDEISIQVICDPSAVFELAFEVSLDNKSFSSIEGFSMSNQSLWEVKTTTPNTLYSFDISTCEFFRVRLVSSNMPITVIGTSYNL